jgi:hypothetical protein
MEAVVATTSALYRTVQADLREAVRGLDAAALNWTPGAETNSIATLVVHTLGSEAEVLRTVAGVAGDRDRDAEFRTRAGTAEELVRALEAGDAYLDEMAGRITVEDLAAVRQRGERAPQTGLYWLLSNYGHAREHLAHVQLTRQLYEQGRGSS